MSYPTHLLCRNGHFYYKVKVPVDLQQHFPSSFIKKTLRTTQLSIAKSMLITMEHQIKRVFILLRTGMLADDMALQVVNEIIPTRQIEIKVPKVNTLSLILKIYIEAKQAEWTEKTKMEVGSVVKLLLDILGDVEISTITRPMVLELRSTLQKLPANLYKKYPGKTIQQILSSKDVEPMSIKSVNKHVARLGGVLRYCMDEGILVSNPAYGLKVSEKKRADEERSTYSKADIGNIIKALPRDNDTPERYWIPLIGLYSGMRLNEICQLYVSDIINFEDQWCFSINGNKDKRLKNLASV